MEMTGKCWAAGESQSGTTSFGLDLWKGKRWTGCEATRSDQGLRWPRFYKKAGEWIARFFIPGCTWRSGLLCLLVLMLVFAVGIALAIVALFLVMAIGVALAIAIVNLGRLCRLWGFRGLFQAIFI